jgi:hypothetical protein
MACIPLAWRMHAGARPGAKNPARVIPAGHDALLDDALICQCHSSFARKKYQKKISEKIQKIRIAAADRELVGPSLSN